MLVGCLVLLGWLFDIAALKTLLLGALTMKAKTAVGFLLAGVSLWLALSDLTDRRIQMPVMDGFAALKLLRENPVTKNIKVIALTSFAMSSDREKMLSTGFDDYIAKPMDTRALPEIVKKYLGQ
jgi:CheY-like chemotaxis protein